MRAPSRRLPILLVVTTVAVVGCASLDPRPDGGAVLYGRSARAEAAWFGVVPLGDPPETVGFGSDIGVACLTGNVGSPIVWFDRSPGDGGHPIREIGVVRPSDADPTVLWVSVAADGTLTSGGGVPEWWPDGPAAC